MSRIMFITNRNAVQCIVFFITILYSFKKFVLICRFLHKLEQLSFYIRCIVTDQSHNNKEVTEGRYQISFQKVLQAFGLSTRYLYLYTKLVTKSLICQEAKTETKLLIKVNLRMDLISIDQFFQNAKCVDTLAWLLMLCIGQYGDFKKKFCTSGCNIYIFCQF